jgi:hypothetical protein
MSAGLVPQIERKCTACTQTTIQHEIPEETDLLSQRTCMTYHTIPLHRHKKMSVKQSYNDLQRQTLRYKWMMIIFRTDPQIPMDDHDMQRQTLRYKWMILISRGRPSGTNEAENMIAI